MMSYQHQDQLGESINLPVGKVVCVGRNYVDHAKELNNAVPDEPVLFIKPATSLAYFEKAIHVSDKPYDTHYELEIAVLVSNKLTNARMGEAQKAVGGIGLALDLTYRKLQEELKEKRLPWEKAKAFDGSCPMSHFQVDSEIDLESLQSQLKINEELRQLGKSEDMIFDIVSLLEYISRHFTLMPGDIVLTGTPAGVGALRSGDNIEASIEGIMSLSSQVL